MIGWQNIFGLYDKALGLREEKISLISSNLANEDTPGYKAKDINFKAIMDSSSASVDEPLALTKNASVDFSGGEDNTKYPIQYRVPMSPSADGNTVNPHYEKTAFMDNVVRYNSTLAFIQSRKAALIQVIKGE